MTPTGSQSVCTLASIAESLSGSVDQQDNVIVTLIFSKVRRQVRCLEAGKDFVDLLLSFLTLPMGCIVKLLSDANLLRSKETIPAERLGISSLSVCSPNSKDPTKDPSKESRKVLSSMCNVYDSVVKMEDTLLRIEKSILLESRPHVTVCSKLLPFPPVEEEKEVNYYCCGVSCHYVTRQYGAKCPRHKRKMDTQCKEVDSDVERHGDSKFNGGYLKAGANSKMNGGYTKAGTHFVITNNLDIYPSSAIKSLSNLKLLSTERVGDLDNKDVSVGTEDVLQLLKASLCSGNVLNKVFGKHIKKSVIPFPVPPYSWAVN